MKTYLALGDSYTIGEQVQLFESFPYQTVAMLRKEGLDITAPEIIAKTGWTTDELQAQINQHIFRNKYDIVTLLIGVNNQYRNRPIENFASEFESLLSQAIAFANGSASNVFVISIPDWGVTPFAADRDTKKIAAEIDAYNTACKQIANKRHCHFIDITTSQRIDSNKHGFLANDQLHPSALEYHKWAEKLSTEILGREI